MKSTKKGILEEFSLFLGGNEGIENWLNSKTHDKIFERLISIKEKPLSKAELSQFFIFSFEPSITYSFFDYYWMQAPNKHTYNVKKIEGFEIQFVTKNYGKIISLEHLKWGFNRLYIDSLLYFGNIRNGFRYFNSLKGEDLKNYFKQNAFNWDALIARGKSLELNLIAKDSRYLISEMACKNLEINTEKGEKNQGRNELEKILFSNFEDFEKKSPNKKILVVDLLTRDYKESITADKKNKKKINHISTRSSGLRMIY